MLMPSVNNQDFKTHILGCPTQESSNAHLPSPVDENCNGLRKQWTYGLTNESLVRLKKNKDFVEK